MTTQTQSHEIVRSVDPDGVCPASRILDFFNPDSIAQAFEEQGWDAEAMIGLLVGIAKDDANNTARERMSAMKMMTDQGKEALSLHGHIRRFTAEMEGEKDGVKGRITTEGIELLKAGAARTMSTLDLLEAGSLTHEMIDVDPKETPDDPGTDANVRVEARPLSSSDSDPGGDGNGRPPPIGGSGCSLTGPFSELQLDEGQRTSPRGPQTERKASRNDQGTVQGADDERRSGLPCQPGRSHQSQGPGNPGPECGCEADPNFGSPRPSPRTTPYTPGESRRRANRRATSPAGVPDSHRYRDAMGTGSTEYSSASEIPTRPPDGDTDRPHIRATVLDPATTGDPDEWPGNTGPWADA